MVSDNRQQSITRTLYAWEINEAQRVFGSRLHYDRVRIHENIAWLHQLSKIGSLLKRTAYMQPPNAVTLGNHCYFPIRLPVEPIPGDHAEHYKLSWLIHELTHVWQYQHMGWRYLFKALHIQFRLGSAAYDFGGEEGLWVKLNEGCTIDHFNLEQQGDITRTYYERVCKGVDAEAWLSYIDQIRHTG